MLQKNWQELIKPSKIQFTPGNDKLRDATLVVEPLERGFGQTLGNALRRVLLSSIRGAAVTAVKFDQVLHEFSSIPGVAEDVVEITLNVKQLAVKVHEGGVKKLNLSVKGPCQVTASMIEPLANIDILNPELIICNINKEVEFKMTLTVEEGKGYVPSSLTNTKDNPIGLIPIDAIFSPIRNVAYKVENTRVGQATDYDRLTMEIKTNGTIIPEDAVALAGRIISDQASYFVNFEEEEEVKEVEKLSEPQLNPNLLEKS